MKKLFVSLIAFVMMFGSINVFSEEVIPEYNTSISGDIALSFNDDWQPGFAPAIQHMFLPPDVTYIQVFANVHITGKTDASSLVIQSAEFPSLSEQIKIDGNGNFDQEVKVTLTGFSSTDSDTINFGAYVIAAKGDRTVRVKIGKGELKTDFLINANNAIKQDYNGSMNSIDFAEFRRNYLDSFMAEYNGMDEQESINTYIYNEWYMKDFVMGKDGTSFNAQTHLKAKTDATNITLETTNNGNTKKFEYLLDTAGHIDQIEEFSGVVPLSQSNVATYASIKAYKANREIELVSTLRIRDDGDAVVGDLNGDKFVNSIDFMILRKYIMGLIERFPTESGFYCADVNDDKRINAIDFAYERQYLLGMIAYFPKESETIIPNTPIPPTPTLQTPTPKTPTPQTPTPGNGMVTYYTVNGNKVDVDHVYEIYVENSPANRIWISAKTECRGPVYADGWGQTYFKLSGSAVNGVDYEKIDFSYFWRIVGSDLFVPAPDNNPKYGFYITPIDTGSDEPKDVEVYFGSATKPAAIIHFTNDNASSNSPVPSTPTPTMKMPGTT